MAEHLDNFDFLFLKLKKLYMTYLTTGCQIYALGCKSIQLPNTSHEFLRQAKLSQLAVLYWRCIFQKKKHKCNLITCMLWLVFTIVPVLLARVPQVLQTCPVAPAKNRLQSNSILDTHFTNIDLRYLKYFTNHRMITGNCSHFPGFCSKVMLIKDDYELQKYKKLFGYN